MASARLLTAVDDGPPGGQLGVDNGVPLGYGIVQPIYNACAGIVAEVAAQCHGYHALVGRRCRPVAHLHRPSAVLHQPCHCHRLLLWLRAVVATQHQVPVELRRRQLLVLGIGRYGRRLLPRPFIVAHHLCHCRSHAARGIAARTQQVVGGTLRPEGRQERTDSLPLPPPTGGGDHATYIPSSRRGQGEAQPRPCILWQFLLVECAGVGVA